MRVAIVGGGISGLSAAYYLKKFSLPVTSIAVYEASSRFGGWIQSVPGSFRDDKFVFETGPRTLRLATGALAELNSIQLAHDLRLVDNKQVEIVSRHSEAARNRYIYFNNKIQPIANNPFAKSPLLPKRLVSYAFKELQTKRRDISVQDESIHSFISRRFGSDLAENFVDPLIKGVYGGDIKELSAASTLLKRFYDLERDYGSVIKGLLMSKKLDSQQDKRYFGDLIDTMRPLYGKTSGASLWRCPNGLQTLVDSLVEHLRSIKSVELLANEPIEKISFSKTGVQIKSKKQQRDFDIVISAVPAQTLARLLVDNKDDEHVDDLKETLDKIHCVDMAVVNFYFAKANILPIKGFGYLVPTSQNSPILGCIMDSVFDARSKHTMLTVMLGGAWYDKYIHTDNKDAISRLAFDEVKRHFGLRVEPDVCQVSINRDAIPQYRVGHQSLLKEIDTSLESSPLLRKRLYLAGNSYDGVGINDCLFRSRRLVQIELGEKTRSKDD